MTHFLGKAVVPVLLEYWIRPAPRRCRLFDGVAEPHVRIRRERVPHEQVGVGLTLVAEHLDAIVHPAGPVPAVLDHADRAVLELENRECFVIALGARPMDVRRHVRVDARDVGLAEEPPAEGDPVAPQVHRRSAPGLRHVPEPVRVRSRVLLPLLHQVHAAEGAFVRHLLRLHVLGREEQLLGVEQQHTGLAARVDHRVRLLERETEGLLAHHVLAGCGGVDRDLGVQPVGCGDRNQFDRGVAQQLAVVGVGARDAVPLGEIRRVPLGR